MKLTTFYIGGRYPKKENFMKLREFTRFNGDPIWVDLEKIGYIRILGDTRLSLVLGSEGYSVEIDITGKDLDDVIEEIKGCFK